MAKQNIPENVQVAIIGATAAITAAVVGKAMDHNQARDAIPYSKLVFDSLITEYLAKMV